MLPSKFNYHSYHPISSTILPNLNLSTQLHVNQLDLVCIFSKFYANFVVDGL